VDVLAFRVAAQGLAARDRTPAQVAASFGLQDSPPGAALTALHARTPDAGALDEALANRELVALPNPRTAVAVLPAADVPAYLAALEPPDERALETILLNAAPGDFEAAREQAVAAIGDALDGRVLSRDARHEELRGRLPAELLPWCKGCQSHHARRGLLTVAALAGRLCFAGREGRQPGFARTDQWTALAPAEPRAAKAEFVRRYLRHLGPSKPADLAAWAGIAPSHARALWETVEDELVEVGRTTMLAEDARTEPPPAKGVRLLGPGDPLLNARDREHLLPKELHKRLWRPVGSPGLVLNDGRPAGFWRARKQGRKLRFEAEWFGKAVDIGAEAERLAAARGLYVA
jgi:Winged helix DNA-binding domain